MKPFVLLALLPSLLMAADMPNPVVPEGVGINIHFASGHEADLDLIAAAGFKFVRMDFGWAGIERKKGEYDWSAYDELTDNLDKRGLRAIYILDYSNALYEETFTVTDPHTHREQKEVSSPDSAESIAAFARWAGAAARHFRGRSIVWEIWNEPNIEFWKPKPDVKQYAALALATCRAVRSADPEATLIAPGSSEFPWTFLESLFASGVLRYLDAVSVHPYRSYSQPPESTGAEYLRLRGLVARYAPAAKQNLPVICSEWGYATHDKGVSLDTQAAFVVRQQLVNLLRGVPLSIWYDWKNDGTDSTYNEHNFGVVDSRLRPKPSYFAVQTMTRELSGYRVVRRLFLPGMADGDFILLCANGAGDHKLVAWTRDEPHAVTFDLELAGPDRVIAVNGDGSGYSPRMGDNRITLDLGPLPKYLTLRQRTAALTMATAWSATSMYNVLVTAGREGVAQIHVTLRNPFPGPLRAVLTVECPGSTWPRSVIVPMPAERTTARDLRGTLHRRDAESAMATIWAEFQREESPGVWTTFARSSDRAAFFITNPLTVAVTPVAGGMRLQIRNPSQAGFAGVAVAGGFTNKVSLGSGLSEASFVLRGTDGGAVGVQLHDHSGNVVAEIRPQTYRRVEVPAFRISLDGDGRTAATATLTIADAPGGGEAPFPKAFRLDYEFGDGWRFIRCVPDIPKPLALPVRPQALGVWVFGDNSHGSLHLRLRDDSGQTFQFGGPKVDWLGWRWVTLDMGDPRHANHWGGANDGVVHGALQWDCPLLFDGIHKKLSGTLWFAGLTIIGGE